MDCDYDPATAVKETTRKSAREKRKLKRQSRFGRLVHKEKPVFDPKDKTFQEYVDEYYGMDYEDLIGDIPCRFKYKSVFPNNFGLTIDEVCWVNLIKIFFSTYLSSLRSTLPSLWSFPCHRFWLQMTKNLMHGLP